jgi:hypothetical protein
MLISGTTAKKHLKEVFKHQEKTGKYNHPSGNNFSGYFLDKGVFIAFAANCDYTVEEFKDENEAIKYAKGIEALTTSGNKI